MNKIINLNKSVYDIYMEYPEILEIMNEMGFHDIVKTGMLQTAGRFMTIPKGAAVKKISLDQVKETLVEKGFTVLEREDQNE